MPASFVNGTLCLGGTLEGFVPYINASTGSGAFEAQVSFTEGDCQLVLEHGKDSAWQLEIAGRRQPRALVLPRGLELQRRLDNRTSEGSTSEVLSQRKKKLSLQGQAAPCGS